MNETSKEADDKETLKNRVKKKRGRSSHSKKSLAAGKTKNSKELEPLNRKPRNKTAKGASKSAENISTSGCGEADSSASNIQDTLLGLRIDNNNDVDKRSPDSDPCGTENNGYGHSDELVIESVGELHQLLYCIGHLDQNLFHYGVTVLKLVACDLTTLPYELGQLTSIEVINVSQNKLEQLPDSIGQLHRLYSLQAELNCLTHLPQSIKNLKLLSLLVVNDNLLKSLPSGISELEQLDTLDVSNNLLETLPAVFRSAETIRRVYVQKNFLKTLPPWLAQARSIQELHLGENQISNWSDFKAFGKVAASLQMLDVCENKLCMLADGFGGLAELSCLNLGRNPFENQKRPWATGNFLTSLPKSFCQLKRVTLLSLDGNQLKNLPNDFGHLVNLRMINLVQNCLETLPDSFCQLQSLELCLLSRNCLQRLPENFGNLPLLNHLEVSNNKMHELPETFKNLIKLTYLDLSNNRLKKEPDFLHLFIHLNYLNLHSNPCERLAGDIVDPELSYASIERSGEAPRRGQFEDPESDDEVEELPSNSQEREVVVPLASPTVKMNLPTNNLSKLEPCNVTKENKMTGSTDHQKQEEEEEEEEEEEDFDWELSNGLYDVDSSNYQEQYLFMPSDFHCKNVRYKSVPFKCSPGQFDDVDD